jgi:hypothetical protein
MAATILEFRSTAEKAAGKSRRRRKTAEIVIFPGVRYERWSQAEAQQCRAVPAVERDRLELLD